jgi:hypothetical protein
MNLHMGALVHLVAAVDFTNEKCLIFIGPEYPRVCACIQALQRLQARRAHTCLRQE